MSEFQDEPRIESEYQGSEVLNEFQIELDDNIKFNVDEYYIFASSLASIEYSVEIFLNISPIINGKPKNEDDLNEKERELYLTHFNEAYTNDNVLRQVEDMIIKDETYKQLVVGDFKPRVIFQPVELRSDNDFTWEFLLVHKETCSIGIKRNFK